MGDSGGEAKGSRPHWSVGIGCQLVSNEAPTAGPVTGPIAGDGRRPPGRSLFLDPHTAFLFIRSPWLLEYGHLRDVCFCGRRVSTPQGKRGTTVDLALFDDFFSSDREDHTAASMDEGPEWLGPVAAGMRVHDTAATELAARCHGAALEGRWATAMRFYAGPGLLIVDEVGYLTLPARGYRMRSHRARAEATRHAINARPPLDH